MKKLISNKDINEYYVKEFEAGVAIYVKKGKEFIPLIDSIIEVCYQEIDWEVKSDSHGKILYKRWC